MWFRIINKIYILFLGTFFLFVTGCVSNKARLYDHKPQIAKYVDFLKKEHTNPVEYIMNLFSRKDIVIIYGRDQREITQFDLYYRILIDQKFIKKVGRTFLNTGSVNNNSRLNSLILNSNLNDKELNDKIYLFYRNFSWQPIWPYRGSLELIKKVSKINNYLPDIYKENLYLANVKSYNWKQTSSKEYINFKCKVLKNINYLTAENIISKIKENTSLNNRKYLIILTHDIKEREFIGFDSIAEIISKAFPGKTAKVMLNSINYNKNKELYEPLHNGKWDASFKAVGNPILGFDLMDSPFGKDGLRDEDIKENKKLRYQDEFDGYIFCNPINDFCLEVGVPEIFNDDFKKELYRRFIISGLNKNEANKLIGKYSRIEEYEYTGFSEYYMIDKWLK